MARVTVLVPNFNGRELLDTLLPSVRGQTYQDHEILLVDDASTDDSVAHVMAAYPEVRVLRAEVNRGFAATVNLGIRHSTSELIAIVNSDVELTPGWLGALVAALDDHPAAGSATGKTLMYHRRGVLDGAGNAMRWSGAATRRGHGVLDRGQFDHAEEVISACAGYALFRHTAFESVGLFDEDLVAYYEDVDWGLRAQLSGVGCRYEPRAIAYHMGGATHRSGAAYLRLERRNLLLVVLKNYPVQSLVRHAGAICAGQIVLIVRALRAGVLLPQLLAIADAVRAGPTTWRKRSRTPGDPARLARMMSGPPRRPA